jgi:hypothetical protein
MRAARSFTGGLGGGGGGASGGMGGKTIDYPWKEDFFTFSSSSFQVSHLI